VAYCGRCEYGYVRVLHLSPGGHTYEALRRCPCNPVRTSAQPAKRRKAMPDTRTVGVCRCGAAKRVGLSLCRECYQALPVELRQSLWHKGERAWARAYGRAARFLAKRERSAGGAEGAE
jgi:hypothetical protein